MSQNQMNDKEEKNTVLVLKGNYRQFDQLQTLFQSGELEKLLGIPILELEAVSQYKPTTPVSSTEKAILATESSLTTSIKKVVQLRQWFENSFEPDWQPVINVVSSSIYQQSFRHRDINTEAVIRAKMINLGNSQAVALVVSLAPEADGEVEIILKICPTGLENYLPQGLTITVIDDEFEAVFEELQTNTQEPWKGLRFNVDKGRFTIVLSLENIIIEEKFEI